MQLKQVRIIIIIILLNLDFVKGLNAQHNGNISLILNPIGFNINSSSWNEHGLGYYKIKNNFSNSIAVLGMYRWSVSNKLSLNIGLGFRQNKYNFNYIITDPFDKQAILDDVNRYYTNNNIVAHFGLSYTINKFEISVGYEFPFEFRSSTNIENYYGPLEIFIDFNTQDVAYFRVLERTAFQNEIYGLATPVLMCDYKLSNRFSINVTSLLKPYGNQTFYQLDIQGDPGDLPDGDYQLNDSRINNHIISLFFGFKYGFN